MKRLILGLVVALLFAAAGRAETNVVTFDFNSGLGPNFAAFDRADGLLAVDTDGPSVRISKPADDGTVRPTDGINAGIRSDFSVHGDFTITADFALNDFPPADDKEINASSMTVLAENGDTLSVLRLRVGDSNFVEMYGKPFGPSGTTGSTLNNGQYRLERTGSTITGLLAPVGSTSFSPVASVDFGSDAVRLQLWGSQGKNPGGTTRSTTSLDVSFDNLVIEADDITGLVPEPSTLTLATFGCLWMLVFSRRRHADR